jgi:hypothetical protein
LTEWQADVDKWVNENYINESKYFPPTTTSKLYFDDDGDPKEDGDPIVEIVGMSDGDSVPLDFRLSVEVSSPHPITKVKISLDGNEVTIDTSIPYGYNFSFNPGDAGEHKFDVSAEDSKGKEGKTEIKLNVGGP